MSRRTGEESGEGRWSREPEDARRGLVAPLPADAEEAQADRDLADAERAVVAGTASRETVERIARLADARTHEERRRRWRERT